MVTKDFVKWELIYRKYYQGDISKEKNYKYWISFLKGLFEKQLLSCSINIDKISLYNPSKEFNT